MCQDLEKIRDPGSPGSWRILDLTFSAFHEILEMFDPVTATLPWDPKDLGSRTENIRLDPSWIQLEQVVVRSCRYWILHNNATVF